MAIRLSHLLCAALGAALVYVVLSREKKEQGPLDAQAPDAEPANDTLATPETAARRRVRAGGPVTEEQLAAEG